MIGWNRITRGSIVFQLWIRLANASVVVLFPKICVRISREETIYKNKQTHGKKEESKSIWTNFVRGITKTITMTTMMMSRMTIELKELALFIIELSVHDYHFVMKTNKSSVIALAASLNVAQLLIDFSSSTPASSMMLMRMLIRKTTRVIQTREEKNDD